MYIQHLQDLIMSIYNRTGEELNSFPQSIYMQNNRYPITDKDLYYLLPDDGLRKIDLTKELLQGADIVTNDYTLVADKSLIKRGMVATTPFLLYKAGMLVKYFLEYFMYNLNKNKEFIIDDVSGITTGVPLMSIEMVNVVCPTHILKIVYPEITQKIADEIYDILEQELTNAIAIFERYPYDLFNVDMTTDTLMLIKLGNVKELRYDVIIRNEKNK